MDDAFEAGGAKPSTASFYAGLAKLDSFPSAYGVPLNFTYGRTGATQVWDLRGDSSCRCLRATGGPYRVAD
ncbi:hypothetical protein [Actinopolymorpha rutila]|uniref:Uncharacterized protein n=1 Tax=Actinopolymorpha rutila TaxID=446787 RepID=A0A852ZK79_9ACTN|nr:hypothetical protein [Actinopolymorpha rutila]NYH93467.1 hypothetical protein [Actinopolymorpha rutila]